MQRYIPLGARKIASKKCSAVCYVYEAQRASASAFLVIGYQAKRGKPEFHFRYPSEAARAAKIAKFFAEVEGQERRVEERKAEKKAKRAQGHSLKVGNVLMSSWGYEQTNVDFFEVVELVGKHSVKLVKIAGQECNGNWGEEYGDRGYCEPSDSPDRAKGGEPFLKRVDEDGAVKIASYAWARLWDGKPHYWSSYA
jgi:hypothetical protein